MNELLSPRHPLEDRDCPLGRTPHIVSSIGDAATAAKMSGARPWNGLCIQGGQSGVNLLLAQFAP
jgi:hypothetical protein